MTFDQYIQNPMGIKNAVMGNREMYRNMYTLKLDTIMVREMGKVNYYLYKDGDKYFCHIKVPSEVVERFYYDVVIEFYPGKDTKKNDKTLHSYEARFYSNDPAFVFTFAHAFIKNKIFITELTDRMSKQAVKERGKERNPMDTVGYVKSLFFAYLLMKRFGLFDKIRYAQKLNMKNLKATIMPADEKIALRQELGAQVATKAGREKAKAARAKREEVQRQNRERIPERIRTSTTNRIGTVKTTRKIGGINNVHRTKRTGTSNLHNKK